MIKPRQRWLYSVFLAHFEVLSEVLVSAPPVSPDVSQALILPDLMEVGVTHIVLLPVHGETTVAVSSVVHFV